MEEENTFLDLGFEEQELYLKIKNDIQYKDSVSIKEIQNEYSIGYAQAHKMFDILANDEILGEEKHGRREVIKHN